MRDQPSQPKPTQLRDVRRGICQCGCGAFCLAVYRRLPITPPPDDDPGNPTVLQLRIYTPGFQASIVC